MPRNSSAGMVTLNTRADAVWMKLSLIQLMRLSSTPRNSMANTGAVMFRVSRKIASMPGSRFAVATTEVDRHVLPDGVYLRRLRAGQHCPLCRFQHFQTAGVHQG